MEKTKVESEHERGSLKYILLKIAGVQLNRNVAKGNHLISSYLFGYKDRVSRDNLLNNIFLVENEKTRAKKKIRPRRKLHGR